MSNDDEEEGDDRMVMIMMIMLMTMMTMMRLMTIMAMMTKIKQRISPGLMTKIK